MKQDNCTETMDHRDARAVIAEHHAFIRAYVRKLGRKYSGLLSGDDLDDITHTVIERILANGLRSFRGDCAVEGYLAVIARNLVFDSLRKIKKDRAVLIRCDNDALERAAYHTGASTGDLKREREDREALDFVKAEASKLPAKQRCIFAMIAFDEMKQEDVAQRLGLRQSTISEHYAKAKKLVLAAVKKRYPDTEFT